MSLGSRINKKNRVIKYLAKELAVTIDTMLKEQDLFVESVDPKDLIAEAYRGTK